MTPPWLPPMVSVNGDPAKVFEMLYGIFTADFRDGQKRLRGLPVWWDRRVADPPYEEGFWHLITRFDKLVTESDRSKVLKRVKQETEGLFAEVYPVSLLQAMKAGEDEEKWAESGADAFAHALFEIIHRIIDEGHPEPGDEGKAAIQPDAGDDAELGQSLIADAFERLMVIRNTPVIKVLPRRVEAKTERLLRTERPTGETGPAMVTFADTIVGTEPAPTNRLKMS